ncbi:MAG TPA: aryl-sulfate sulfotransferase [Myxococcales bacterium]|jgi:hypothetical protein
MTVLETLRPRWPESRLCAALLALALCACPATKPPAGADADSFPPGLDAADPGRSDGGATATDGDAGSGDAAQPLDAGVAGPDAARPTSCPFSAPGRTVGLIECTDEAYEGYTLFAPIWSSNTYLVDMVGRVVHTWPSMYLPGMSFQLLANGDLMRTAHKSMFGGLPTGGGIQRFSWDGELLWDFEWLGEDFAAHHDFAVLPNGNVLLLYWETKQEIDVLGLGYTPNGPVWPDAIVEVLPTGPTSGEVVWEWHMWDHILPMGTSRAEHPELLELSYTRTDWLHSNAIDYNAELDQIVISSRNLSELWIIDHGTTTEEAKGHSGGKQGKGGDLLYRWGRPMNYGVEGKQMLFGQHNVQWIAPGLPGAGHLLLFNNGMGRNYSSVDELATPVDAAGAYLVPEPGTQFGPETPAWTYTANPPQSFFANHISGAQRLPNGNTLVCSGDSGAIFEVTGTGKTVWSYRSPVGRSGVAAQGSSGPIDPDLFRAIRLPPDFPGFAGRDLTPGKFIEDAPGVSGDPALVGDCLSSEDCKLCCASVHLVGWTKLSEWMTPCICGTAADPGPCAVACKDWFCAEAPPAGVPSDLCTACTNQSLNSSTCIGVRQRCIADAQCLALQTCRLACPQ